MALKIYVCNKYKSLRIGRHCQFRDGVFETEDPKLQHQIESCDAWTIDIHYQDTEEEMARIGRERLEAKNAEVARARKQVLDEQKSKEKQKAKVDWRAKAKQKKADADALDRKKIVAADEQAKEASNG